MFKKMFFTLLFLLISINSVFAITLTWDANPDADYHVIYCSINGAEPVTIYTTASDQITSLDLSKVVINGGTFVAGVNYTFLIKAFNTCGNSSDFSDGLAYLIPIPATISTLAVSSTKLTWSYTGIDSNPTSFRLTYSSTAGGTALPTITAKTIIVSPTTTSYDLCSSIFAINVPYTFTVSACNSSGVWGSESNSVTYTRRSVSKPTNLKIR